MSGCFSRLPSLLGVGLADPVGIEGSHGDVSIDTAVDDDADGLTVNDVGRDELEVPSFTTDDNGVVLHKPVPFLDGDPLVGNRCGR